MYLTPFQERMLKGEFGWVYAKALEIIVKVGEALGSDRLVEISHAHVSGVSYSNIGEPGLDFLRDFYREMPRFRVYTTINPGCVDYGMLSQVIDNKYLGKQALIDEALVGMGAKPVFTCIPYYHRPPLPGEHLAWGESSAVIFANSYFGAMTNREGGPLALASALTGFTYYHGLHELENRVARVLIKISPLIYNKPLSLAGLWIGENVRKVPMLEIKEKPLYEIKALLAAMAASGSHALAVLDGITPKGTYKTSIEETITLEFSDVEKYIGETPGTSETVLGYVGCPHTHPEELVILRRLLEKYREPKRGRLLVTMPPEIASTYSSIVRLLLSRKVDIALGTCPVVSVLRKKYDLMLTNSGKAFFYMRKIHGLKVGIASLKEIVESIYT
ncbi:aconitase X catalytic domain-containing protein [Thermosphaera aggregans]|jgi:predicted aconitase|uniref:Phosphomevalonate dehydratase large subunit n=1 Tax=Thermosphaera aggregans (strain DSM 11486 / M11TL) TaxID=633148 RepID=D5U2S4_THEAM|nr:aconitase X [Thermosphaera aggregans]ADG91424.1 predicted aconitase subunit 1 [Thermosphaera aggregans DSM 11486]